MRRALAVILLLAAALSLPQRSLAETARSKERAKEAYDRGLAAHRRGDVGRAAEEFARADALAPSPVALQAALDAAIEADDVALGAELLDRSKRAPAPPALAASITAAHLKFKDRAGRLRVLCPSDARCRATLDGAPIAVDEVVWAKTGARSIVLEVDGETETRTIEVTASGTVEVSPTQVPGAGAETPASDGRATEEAGDARPAPSSSREGLPRIFFYGGVGLTVALAGTTAYFALETQSEHSRFRDVGCGHTRFPECEDIRRSGETHQSLTNVMLALTGASAVATAVIGVAFTNWNGPLITATPGGAGATWHATF